MALNKKLIVLSGVGLVFAGIGAGVIGYKASQVADGQKQMDDSKASMGGQLSFGLASPMATMAGTAGADFMAGIQTKVMTDVATKHAISYVNLSDQIQGDLITGISHSVPEMEADGNFAAQVPNTKVGDPQAAIENVLKGAITLAATSPEAAAAGLDAATLLKMYKASDFEIPNLKAADIRRLLNNDLSSERTTKLFGSDKAKAASSIKGIHDAIESATVISLNVGIEDIIEEAMDGVNFSTIVSNTFVKPAEPNLGTLMGSLENGGASVMKSAINAVGNLNGALSAIRRLNPTAQIALGTLGTYGIDGIDAKLGLINQALQVAALTQDIKTGDITVAPMDPMAIQFPAPGMSTPTLSLQNMYETDKTHQAVSALFAVMMYTNDPANAAKLGAKLVQDGVTDPTKATNPEKIKAFAEVMHDSVALFESMVSDVPTQTAIYDGATTDVAKAQKIQSWMASDAGKAAMAAAAQAAAAGVNP